MGAFAKRTSKAFAGGLSFVGAQTKRVNKALVGALSFVGSYEGHKVILGTQYFKELAGGLSFVGALSRTKIIGVFWDYLELQLPEPVRAHFRRGRKGQRPRG